MDIASAVPTDSMEGRYRALNEALERRGLGSVREDSRLCAKYVIFGAGDVEQVADTMLEMDFFIKHTGYRRAIGVVRRDNWPFFVDRDQLSAMAKRRAIRWLVRAGDEETLAKAPPSLGAEIEAARKIVAMYPRQELPSTHEDAQHAEDSEHFFC